MSYTLYCSPDSANLVVRMALEEIGAPYTDVLAAPGEPAFSAPQVPRLAANAVAG